MAKLREVGVPPLPYERFRPLLGEERYAALAQVAETAGSAFAGRTVWNVNSTATGGGVAEMLTSLLAYARGAGVNARWLVIEGTPAFFAVTKRIHNGLHGMPGDGGALDVAEHRLYEAVLHDNAEELQALVQPGDIVLLHDPQTAGLVEAVQGAGALAVWRCHVGHDDGNWLVERTWDFLRPYLEGADAFVFSRRAYAPEWMNGGGRLTVIPPSIDPFSPKNQDLDADTVRSVLSHIGVITRAGGGDALMFTRRDGSPGRVDRYADIVRTGHSPLPDTPLVVQVSRWDRLKDMTGVMAGFAQYVDGLHDAHLALVGPNVSGVADDPEGGEVLDECIRSWRELPHAVRRRVQLVCLPMTDAEENAVMVNALQRHAAVVVQKSLHEGFGLTVAEAMWKERPIVASAVGGIQDQIVDGEHGLLLSDPTDLEAFGVAVRRLLTDRTFADQIAKNARERAVAQFLGSRHLVQYAELFGRLWNL